MPTQDKPIAQPIIKVAGTKLPEDAMNALIEVRIETDYDIPDMFELTFQDDEYKLMDGILLDIGMPVELGFIDDASRQPVTITKGEIIGIEPHYDENMTAQLVVRGYSKLHRLNRGKKTRTFLKRKDSEIVSEVCKGANLTVQADATTAIRDYVIQHNQTDLEFLRVCAYRNGYELIYEDDTLKFRKPKKSPKLTLTRGLELRSFTPRLSAARQVNEVSVQGWDPVQKKAVTGKAATSSSNPQIGFGKWGGQAAQSAFAAARYKEVRAEVTTEAAAQKLAQSILDEINAGFVEAEGMAFGTPKLRAGVTVNLQKLGTRFSGTYSVTSATHVYNGDEGYNTFFRVEGKKPKLMSDLTTMPYAESGVKQWLGVVPAIVTNNKDPENRARVKVKFPWLGIDENNTDVESAWARLCSLDAGNERGFFWLPEVNDEVLIAFEQGDFNRPIILGMLWNGRDKPPETQSNAINAMGEVKIRTLKTRMGHILRFVDDDAEHYIEIIDAKEGTKIKLDAKTKELIITCKGNVSINADGTTKVDAKGNVDISSKANISIKGTGNVSVEASGQLTLKGSMVNIN
jgi:uncharacterized protein involved in type VI secretion and phage assembly